MKDDFYYFATSTVQPDLFGTPSPVPGTRVHFDPAAVAAFGSPRHWPSPLQAPSTRQGMLVYRDPTAVLSWPCRLWRVNHLDEEFAFSPTTPWLRCDSFDVIEELPGWRVFGPHGAAIARLIADAELLGQGQVDVIAAMDGTQEWQARRTFLERWRSQQPQGISAYEPAGWGSVHVGGGVELAAARTGEQLFGWIEEAAYWPILADPSWREAYRAAVAMMTALSAPQLLQEHETEVLTARWETAH